MTASSQAWSSPSGEIHLSESLAFLSGLPRSSVDFCYIDPPFMTQSRRQGKKGGYNDNWTSGITSYIDFLRVRLTELRLVLTAEGSVMVHVDPRVSHYVKVMMDEVFGGAAFINEIAWCYNSGGAGKRALAKKHDSILFYANSPDYYFKVVREPYPHDYGDRPGFHPEGRMLNDWWQIPILSTSSNERTGYPTQKPLPLLERAIEVGCKPGGVVLDFFGGSGTTAVAAARLGHYFLTCDENPESVAVMVDRCNSLFCGV